MKSPDFLLAAWDGALSRNGEKAAIYGTGAEVLRTFAQIEKRARGIEGEFDQLQFDTGDVLAVQIGNHPDWPSILLAGIRRQLVILPLERSISEQERRAALEICRATALISAAGQSLEISRLKTDPSTAPADWETRPPVLLKLTSGTTATPRAIRFRSAQLLADCNQICETMGIRPDDINFGVVPISHSYGFSNLLTPLLARGIPIALSSDRLPRAVLDDLARTKATVFAGMPVFYQAFCEMERPPALPNLRLCISAGAPLTATLARKFREKYQQPIRSFYGSSECGGICYDRDGENLADGFVGTQMNGVKLEMVDPAAAVTQVRVRSAAVGDGYFPEEDAQKLGDGVFVPDDLLARQGGGFKIVGRISDVINVAGKKVNPAEVEAQLLQFAGVREVVVFARKSALRNEEVAACVVAHANVQESDLLQFCRTRLSGWQVPKRIFLLDALPVSERGKTSRRELAERFAVL
jgi:acyl-CoA synthetase (AMP-forming)/AMP-acid ligase II